MKNLPNILLYGASALGVIASILVFVNDDTDTILYLTYFLSAVAILLALISGIYASTQSPGSIKKTIIGIGSFVVIAVVSYLFSSDEVLPMYGNISAGISRLVDVQLISMYILCAVSALAIVYSSVVKFIK